MKKIFAILATAAALFTMASCEKFEDGRPAKDLRSEFSRMYPDAWDVEWEYEAGVWEVSFETGKRPNGTEHTAWYDGNGNWIQTKTEFAMVSVPQNIKDFLAASEYGNSRVDDMVVDYYETPTGNFYRFEIMLNGLEVDIDVTEDGKVSLAGLNY